MQLFYAEKDTGRKIKMGLIVQKFGGTSVADTERLRNVARIITDTYKAGNQVVVVLSAQGVTLQMI